MGLINTALDQRANTLKNPDPWLLDAFVGQPVHAGVAVNQESALTLSAFYGAVRIVAEDTASLPLKVFERLDPRGRQEAREHPAFELLHTAPNPEQTAMEFRELMQAYVLMRGNAFAEIVRDDRGQPLALWPILPTRVRIERQADGRLVYDVSNPQGDSVRLDESLVWHWKGLSANGLTGLSIIDVARQTLGLGLATEQYAATWFGSGGQPPGILKHPGRLDDPGRKNLRESWRSTYTGLTNAHRMAILEEGMEYEQIGVNPEASQLLASRKFSVAEVARWFRLPLHKLAEMDRATFNNISAENLSYVQNTLRAWLVRIEQSAAAKLLSQTDRNRGLFVLHNLDALLRGDIATRFESYVKGRTWGWYSADDVRELEDLNPLPDKVGEVYLAPLNMVPAESFTGGRSPFDPAPSSSSRSRLSELRAATAAGNRRATARTFEPVLREAAERFVRAEHREVIKLVELELRGLESFEEALGKLYRGELRGHGDRIMGPALSADGETVARVAAGEIGSDLEQAGELGDFLATLAATFAFRYTESSRAQLLDVARGNQVDPAGAVRARADEWLEGRAQKVGRREAVGVSGAVARETWRRLGVERTRWVADNENCPICDRLNGQVRIVTELYAEAGAELDLGAGKIHRVRRATAHPPIHSGCDCTLVAA